MIPHIILLFICGISLFVLQYFLMIHVGGFYAPTALAFNLVSLVRSQRCFHLLNLKPKHNDSTLVHRWVSFCLARVHSISTRTVLFYGHVDKMYGPLLTLFILFDLPLSGTILIDQLVTTNNFKVQILTGKSNTFLFDQPENSKMVRRKMAWAYQSVNLFIVAAGNLLKLLF